MCRFTTQMRALPRKGQTEARNSRSAVRVAVRVSRELAAKPRWDSSPETLRSG